MSTRHALVLTAATPKRMTVATDDASRVAEVERLVHATIPLLQWRAITRPLFEARAEWVADIDNRMDPAYDERAARVEKTARELADVDEAIIANARAARVQAIRMSAGIRATLLERFGLDYSETTGDAERDLWKQWALVVEIADEPLPF
jgi:hypothetical protein